MNGQLVRDAVIDDITNTIALRSDLHTTFDAAKFVAVPKQDERYSFTWTTMAYVSTLPLSLHESVSIEETA